MLRSATIAVGLLVSFCAPAVAAESDEPACYHTMVIGRLLDASNFVSLDDLLGPPENPDTIRLGGRADWLIRIEGASGRKRVPADTMTAMAITGALPKRNSALVLYLQKLKDGRWFAIDWSWAETDWQGRYVADSDDGPPQCER